MPSIRPIAFGGIVVFKLNFKINQNDICLTNEINEYLNLNGACEFKCRWPDSFQVRGR